MNIRNLGEGRSLRSSAGTWKPVLANRNGIGRLRVNVVALGDVGATFVMGLKLLGSEEIESIGMFDLNEKLLRRYELEFNQIAYPSDFFRLPEVRIIGDEELFDCEVFVFCATKGIAAVGSDVADVRMQQLDANRELIRIYATKARKAGFKGLFAVVSDPVELLAQSAWYYSNCDEFGCFDNKGLCIEQVQGYGLGVMNARAAYYAKKDERFAAFLTEGRVFGPHGKSLVVANSIDNYEDELSIELSRLAAEANLEVRELGYKPYIAPALSSAAISILLTVKGEEHYGSVGLNEIFFGCRNKYTEAGLWLEELELPDKLYARIEAAYRELEELSL